MSAAKQRIEPKERPIIMQPESVRGVLAGRKTMTRRVVKLPATFSPLATLHHLDSLSTAVFTDGSCVYCPYGKAGDKLWVRETCDYSQAQIDFSTDGTPIGSTANFIAYRATYDGTEPPFSGAWKPSIFMPRWASRITLEIVNVRVERLNDISEEDVRAEGVFSEGIKARRNAEGDIYYSGFADGWDSINGKRKGCAWADSPWCWVIGFKKVEATI
jgi:hypothetical protein